MESHAWILPEGGADYRRPEAGCGSGRMAIQMNSPALSVVMPAHDEAGRIGANVRSLLSALGDVDLEVVVSDDGSTDATAAEVEAVADPRVRLVRNPHKGRGAALRAGMGAATGEIIVTVDADLSYGPEEVRKLFNHLRVHPECDLVIGSCWMNGGGMEGVPPFRRWMSLWGNWVLRFAFHGRFHTVTGVLKGFRRGKLERLQKEQGLFSEGKEFHLELLHKACVSKWRIEELPARLVWRRERSGGLPVFSILSHLGFLVARRDRTFDFMGVVLAGSPIAVILGLDLLRRRWDPTLFTRQQAALHWWLLGQCALGIALLAWVRIARNYWRLRLEASTPPPPSP